MSDPQASALFGLLTLDPPVYCERQALGTTADMSVGGVAGTINLPGLPEWGENPADPLHMPLVAPRAASGWKRGQTPFEWGFPASYPAGAGRGRCPRTC